MQNDNKNAPKEYDRLKEINAELSKIANQRRECRSKTTIFGAAAGVLLAVSMIVLFQNLLNSNNDWQSNPNSPVHEVATQSETSTIVTVVSLGGIIAGLVLFVMARGKCNEANIQTAEERVLMDEMRALRDKMYVKGERAPDNRFRPKKDEQTVPLTPDEARGEYVGVYSPPGSKKK